MVRIATYEGSVDELAQFVNRVWSTAYAGKMTFPAWNADYFTWQFRIDSETSRNYLLAAYDGSTLAGVLLGTGYSFRTPVGLRDGAQWSWLSIDAPYRNHGLAKALHAERVRRQIESRAPLIVGFRYVGSEHSLAERPHGPTVDPKFNRKIGFWVRILNPERFAAWHRKRLDAWMARIAAPFLGIPAGASSDPAIRPYTPHDLDACLALAEQNSRSSLLAIAWDRQSLGHQLGGHPVTQTLVLEEHGTVTGFVNFHFLNFHARWPERVGIFDLIVLRQASSAGRRRLLNAALASMRQQNALMALKLRSGDVDPWPLLWTHFVPQPKDSFLVIQSATDGIEISSKAPLHLLWR